MSYASINSRSKNVFCLHYTKHAQLCLVKFEFKRKISGSVK